MSFATCPECSTRRPIRPDDFGKALNCSVCGHALAPVKAEHERTVRVNAAQLLGGGGGKPTAPPVASKPAPSAPKAAVAAARASGDSTIRVNSGIFDRRAEKAPPAKNSPSVTSLAPPPDATIRMKASDLLGGATPAASADEAALGEMELPANAKFSLEVLNGPHKGRSLDVSENPFTLGRDFWDVGGKDAQISRVHAAVEIYGTRGVLLRDVGSTNGTFVNGRLVTAARLKNGDTIRLGPVELRWKANQ